MRSRIASEVAATALLVLGAAGASAGEALHAEPDRTAFIGTGHAAEVAHAGGLLTSHGSPASAHWSASIGTGHVSGDSIRSSEALAHVLTLEAPLPHWSAKIGTGHATEPTASVPNSGVRLSAGK